MKTISCILMASSVLLFAHKALPTGNEFNWTPAARIDVGNAESESSAEYWSDSPAITRLGLTFPSGRKVDTTGRLVTEERVRIGLGSFGWGKSRRTVVVRRLWDTRQGPVNVTLELDPHTGRPEGREEPPLPVWKIRKNSGDPHWVYLYYAIPRDRIIVDAGKENERLKRDLYISFKYDKPTPSYEYTFFVTRDWEVLGEDHYGGVSATRDAALPYQAYLNGLAAIGYSMYDSAISNFQRTADDAEYERLAARMVRLAKLKKTLDGLSPDVEHTQEEFSLHYDLGLYASANGFWEEALECFSRAVDSNPDDAEATYKLAEAMEYCRLPISEFAPVLGRAGDLFQQKDPNTVDMLVAIQMEKVPWMKKPNGDIQYMCNAFDKNSMELIERDWSYVKQSVWGASRGMYNLNYTFRTYDKSDPDWVFQAGWLWGPRDSEVPVRGTFDYCTGMAGYGSSHCGGVDCGVSGCAQSQIGPGRGWEVFLHEWNHGFDWTIITADLDPGYPVTHSSGSCGKFPQVSMGCGHRSSMYYYINPSMYRRHEPSDIEVVGSHVRNWMIGDLKEFDTPEGMKGDQLEKWLIEKDSIDPATLDQWKQQWQNMKSPPADQPEQLIESEPAPRRYDTIDEYLLHNWVYSTGMLAKEDPSAAEKLASAPGSVKGRAYESPDEFVDLLKVFPDAGTRSMAWAETFVWSPKDQEVRMWLGFNDGAYVWVNGRQKRTSNYYAIAKWEDLNRTDMVANFAVLRKGWNHVLVECERLSGDWGFSVGFVNFDNTPVEGLKYQASRPAGEIAKYTPPEAGRPYSWNDVKDDYLELLPSLSDEDLRQITGLRKLTQDPSGFFFDVDPVKGSATIPGIDENDKELNNYLNWGWEASAAIRYEKGGEYRDLIIVKPEYWEEYLHLLPSDAEKNVLGVVWMKRPNFEKSRFALVIDTKINGDYPKFEKDILAIPGE